MQTIIATDFSEGALPERFFCDSPHFRFVPGGLSTGRDTGFIIDLPGHGWKSTRVEIELVGDGAMLAYCAWDGVLGFWLGLEDGPYVSRRATYGHATIATSNEPLPARRGARSLRFDFTRDTIAASVDGVTVIRAANPRGGEADWVFAGGVHMAIRGECVISRVAVLGEGALNQPLHPAPPRTRSDYFLEAAIDITDDLIPCPFDERMFDAYFAELASWGVVRTPWIFNGLRSEGQLDAFPLGIAANAAATMDRIGELFAAGVRAAHRHGIAVDAIIKPFEMGFATTLPHGSAAAKLRGRLDLIGGRVEWITHFAAAQRDLMTARRPDTFGKAVNDLVTRIDLVKEDDRPAAVSPDDVLIFVSDDNATYRPYTGPVQRGELVENREVYLHIPSGPRATRERRSARVLRFDGLQIRERFVALAVNGTSGSFTNRLVDLLHVYGPGGEERMLTLACKIRSGNFENGRDKLFTRNGLEFDQYYGSPSAGAFGGFNGMNEPFRLDAGACHADAAPPGIDGRFTILGFAMGKDRSPVALMSPAFPEARKHWLKWVRDALDMGADGIEFRVGNHHTHISYSEFGFEQPVRDAFLARHGVDIWAADSFDRAAFRRLRAEYYTQALREARALVNSFGKTMALHIESSFEPPDYLGGPMDQHWDWRRWLEEKLADRVTLKTVWPGSRQWQEAIALTRKLGIPTVYAPYSINYFSPYNATHRKAGGERAVLDTAEWGRRAGCDGFQFYEVAAAVQATPDGKIVMAEPALREGFRKMFRK